MDRHEVRQQLLGLVKEVLSSIAGRLVDTSGIESFAERLDRIDARLHKIELAALSPIPSLTLTLAEAIVYTGTKSDSGFRKWCDRWNVRRCDHGTYSRRALDAGKKRQAAAKPKPRKRHTRKKATSPMLRTDVYPEAA